MENDKYIRICENTKIANPAYVKTINDFTKKYGNLEEAKKEYDKYISDALYTYSGPIINFSFPTKLLEQKYETIQQILQKNNLKLEYIFAGEIISYYHTNTRIINKIPVKRMKFIACTEDKSIVWYKYEIPSTTSSTYNYIYICGKRILLTEFIKNANNYIKEAHCTKNSENKI